MTGQPLARTYYSASGNPPPARPTLTDSQHCDVCVVGGGIAGTSTALHLAERGFDVILLEAQQIGWGASGRSGAQVLSGVAASQGRLEKLIGVDDARKVWDIQRRGRAPDARPDRPPWHRCPVCRGPHAHGREATA
ncbi:MAG: FAD-binding oxidoreductase [Steroidobacteraceae bacterium]